MRRFLINGCVGSATAFVLLAPHLRMYSAEATRYYTFWGRHDAVALAVLIAALGAALAGLHGLARFARVNWVDRAADGMFVCVLGLGVVAVIRSGHLGSSTWWQPLTTIAAAAALLLGIACLHPRLRAAPRFARSLCLILSPAILVVLFQMLSYPEFSVPLEAEPAVDRSQPVAAALSGQTPGGGQVPGNVYLFVFDEWSYARTFTDDFAEEMPNLARFVEDATVYHDAHAPFHVTRLSLPGILFQTDEVYTWAGGTPAFVSAGSDTTDARLRPNVFSRMKARGYRTYLTGFSHPYRRLFGAELDNCFSAADRRGDNDGRFGVDDLWRHLRCASALVAVALPKPAALEWRVNAWWGIHEVAPQRMRVAVVHERSLMLMRQPAPSFAVLHYPLPHAPLIFDRDGAHEEFTATLPMDFGAYGRDGFVRPRPENHIARYAGNLRYLDTVLGELLAALRDAGNFDDATIVLTSDHTWRFDPALDDLYIARGLPFRSLAFDPAPPELTHVPLIIRHRGQHGRSDMHEPVRLIDLMEMLETHPRDAHLAAR